MRERGAERGPRPACNARGRCSRTGTDPHPAPGAAAAGPGPTPTPAPGDAAAGPGPTRPPRPPPRTGAAPAGPTPQPPRCPVPPAQPPAAGAGGSARRPRAQPPGAPRSRRGRMETPFYHDDVLSASAPSRGGSSSGLPRPFPGGSMMKKDGLGLSDQVVATLKAPGQPLHPLRGAAGGGGEGPALLSSAELGLLKLGSPELERLIIQSNGLVTTTPTSSQFLYPKVTASEEQEFAEGFVKALEDLHKQNQLGAGGGGGAAGGPPGDLPPAASLAQPPPPPPEPPVYANLSSYPGTTVNYATETVPYPPPPGLGGAPPHPRLQPPLKDEPQIVPEVPSFGESPPLSPIDMDTQERIKAERKRLRNRIAASKCRKRKLERISRLEEKVKSLKSQNTELASTASLLREQVAQLKQKVLSHVNSGCQLLPQQHQVPAY
ncbi:LOW QUALITY PROTEIN: transcription factor JunD [Lepidochelys kempii]|uniref:LOW QUALITY PROTEIN: transcription factor JunD n=1 Tax=Lepidochelys kempii TaxID=8472 RepID=UPI003C6FCAE5